MLCPNSKTCLACWICRTPCTSMHLGAPSASGGCQIGIAHFQPYVSQLGAFGCGAFQVPTYIHRQSAKQQCTQKTTCQQMDDAHDTVNKDAM